MGKKRTKRFVCDFETSTPEFYLKDGYARVWAWSLTDIDGEENIKYGNEIDSLLMLFENRVDDIIVYFHNLKFDGQYLTWALEDRNFEWKYYDPKDKSKKPEHTYTTLITDMGAWYQMQIYYSDHKITIRDSLKLYNMSVDTIAKSLGFDMQKLDLDYERYRPVGYELTPHEVDYITHDVEIVSKALKTLFDEGHTKLTIGSNALADFKKRTPNFKELFPELSDQEDAFVRCSYKGGFTYANPIHRDRHYKKHGVVFDYNSLYTSILYNEMMPYGKGVEFEKRYKYDPEYPLYVQRIFCDFKLKKGKIPSLQLKHNVNFLPTEYIEEGEDIELTLASPDLELFFEQYDVNVIFWDGGYKYKARDDMFKNYIDYWSERKIQAKKEGNKTMYLVSKLFMNSLYGKFGTNPHGFMKRPKKHEDGAITFEPFDDNTRKSVYVPVATFTTAYGRKKIIEACQYIRDWSISHKGYDAWTYSDTDSIHAFLNKHDVRTISLKLGVDDYKLGYLKLESEFTEAKYLHSKCYMERMTDGNLNVCIAGLPKKLAPIMTFKNFKQGFSTKDLPQDYLDSIGHKLTYKAVKGGVLLAKIDFTIK